MSPSSGKASGDGPSLPKEATPESDGAKCWCRNGQAFAGSFPKNHVRELHERIAELEAELAALKAQPEDEDKNWTAHYFRKWSKAEAEVERLKTDLIWWALHASSVHRCDHNIEGGGRESESLSARKATRKTGHYHVEFDPNCSAATAMLAILATPEQWAEFQRVARGVNPSGDTLGRGGRESGDQGPGSVPGRPGRPAAANPAARKERASSD